MRKVWLIIKREYLTRVRTKGFLISTIALPLLSLGILVFTALMAKRQVDYTLKIAILDNVGGLAPAIAQGLTQKLPSGQPAFEIVRTLEQVQPEDKVRQQLRAQVREGRLDGYLVVSKEALSGKPAEFHTRNPGNLPVIVSIRRAVSDALIARRLSDQGIRVENLKDIVRGVDVTLVRVTDQGETVEKGQTLMLAMVTALMLYITLLVYGMVTMRSVFEEKSTRVMEILVSSVRPIQLMAGKILGVAAVALTQYLIWTVSGALLALYGASMVQALRPGTAAPAFQLPVSLLVFLVLFFLGGYFLYASLYAAVGAIVSNEEDAQQLQFPVTMLIVLSLLLFTVIMRNPNSKLSTALSLFPLFSPILMPFRISLQTPPLWEIILALNFLALTTAGVVYASAKIYRVGVLLYGKRPSVMEIIHWLRYT